MYIAEDGCQLASEANQLMEFCEQLYMQAFRIQKRDAAIIHWKKKMLFTRSAL